jgi:hypothetical protein
MAKLTLEQAFKNVDIVVATVEMNRAAHVTLGESMLIVKEACTANDAQKEAKKEVKDE